MADIDTVVSVSITQDSDSPTREGFGTPAILTYHNVFPELYRVYEDLAGMASDGFSTNDSAYRLVQAVFNQEPRPASAVVARLPAAPAFVTQLTMTSAVQGQKVRFKVLVPEAGTITDPVVTGGVISPTGAVTAGTVVSIEYTVQAAATTTTVATAVELLTEAVAGVASTAASAVVSLTPVTAGRRVYAYDLENCTIEETTADAGYDTALSALELADDVPDWYFILTDSSSTANVLDVAAWTLSRKKMYFAATQSSGLLAGTDTLGSTLLGLSNDRTVLIYAKNAHEHADAAWVGVIAPQTPGSITAALKELVGVSPKQLSATQKLNLETDNINHYQTLKGLPRVRPGVTTSGEWIDIRHGIDALESRVQEDAFALLANAAKVPFTASGFVLIESAIDAACQAFVGDETSDGLLVKGSVRVVMPNLATIPTADKQARRLRGVKFFADISGAVHALEIAGTLSNA
jgi:hypothetical protein